MVKSAGFLKKLKNIGNLIGKGVSWVNKNIIKPINPIIDTALDFVPYGSTIKNVKNTITQGLDALDNVYQTQDNKRIQNLIAGGADVLLDTQRSKQDQKYLNRLPLYDDYSSQPSMIKGYANPFGSPIN